MSDKNLWECICDDEMLEFMRLLGCDEKYINQKASDYEMFAEFCRMFEDFSGSNVRHRFLERLNDAVGVNVDEKYVTEENAPLLWRRYNGEQCEFGSPLSEPKTVKHHIAYKLKNSNEKLNNIFDLCEAVLYAIKTGRASIDDIHKYVENHVISKNYDENISFVITVKNDSFVRPDRYHASLALNKQIRGEKCNKSEYDILIYQILCELLCRAGRRSYELHISGNMNCVGDLAEYLSLHNMRAKIYARCQAGVPCEEVLSLCRRSTDKCHIFPEFVVTKNNIKDQKLCYFDDLARVYPIGAIAII